MVTHEQCLTRIDEIFEAAHDPSAAYLIRSRLRRATLSCARLVSEMTGTPKPHVPGAYAAPVGANAEHREILRFCARVHSIADTLCQPSESFDTRWADGWRELSVELDGLRRLIATRRAASERTVV